MSATYTQRQIMLSFAYLAYTDELCPGIPSPDSTIKKDLITNLSSNPPIPIPPIAGQWSLVWGPVTYTVPGSYYQDNMMYVVQLSGTGSDIAQYAVAVRGTDGKVLLDWFFEDFDIIQMMPWPLGSSAPNSNGNVSESTSISITVLLAMEDATSNQTLLQFLQSEMSNLRSQQQASVCFTGHSLGATLSSTLALYMRDNQSTWDPASKAIVTAINFAGPSAGDDTFAAYFNNVFSYTGTSPLPFWSSQQATGNSYADCVRASLDVAPMAWNVATMNKIEGIYGGHLLESPLPPLGAHEIIGYILDATSANNYTQFVATQPPLTVAFIDKTKLPQPPLNKSHWISEIIYQHHASYPNTLGVPALLQLFPLEMFTGPKNRMAVTR